MGRQCRKLLLYFICFILVFQLASPHTLAAEKLLTMAEAIKLAINEDTEIAKLEVDVNNKQLELLQASKSVSDHALKSSGIYALIFGEDFNLETDLKYKLKIPKGTLELNKAKKKVEKRKLEVKLAVQQLYLNTFQAMVTVNKAKEVVGTKKRELLKQETLLALGLANKEQVEKLKQEKLLADSNLKKALLNYKSMKLELGDKIGMNLESGFRFEVQPIYANLDQEVLWMLIEHGLQEDVTVYEAREARKIAETTVSSIKELYKVNFGSATTSIIESMYNDKGTVDDFDAFLDNYDTMLTIIKLKWLLPFIIIPAPFGPVPIPIKLIQGKYQGLRYFGDVKYSLPVAMLELDKARIEEYKIEKEFILKLKKAYLNAKTVEETYAQALRKQEQAESQLEIAKLKYQMDLIKKAEFEEAKAAFEDVQKQTKGSQFIYMSTLYQVDFETSGGLTKLMKEGILPYKEIEDGLDPIYAGEKTETVTGKWSVTGKVNNMTSSFAVEIGPGLGISHYSLHTKNGKQIGEKVKVGEKIDHLNVVFQNTADLMVIFYNGSQQVGKGTLDGYGSIGDLIITLK